MRLENNYKIGQIFKEIGLINQDQVKTILEEQKTTKKPFGRIMLEKKIVSSDFLHNVLSASSGDEKAIESLKNKKVGQLMVDLDYTTNEEINNCLLEQEKSNKKIGEIAQDKGYISKIQFTKVLSVQKKIVSFFIVGMAASSLLTGCKTPNVGNYSVVQNYSDGSGSPLKVLTVNPAGSVNYYDDGTIAISNIPFYQQGNDNTCGQATMTSILNYWGVGLTYQNVVNQTNSWNMFTDVNKITEYLRKKGIYAQDYRGATTNFIKDRIRKGLPPIVLLDFGSLSSEHYVIVKGYNDDKKKFLILDPVDGPNIEIDYDNFENMWANKSLKKLGLFGDKYDRIVFDIGGN